MSRLPVLPCMCSGMEGISMYDITLDEFPPDRLAAIVHWRNDPAVNRYLRQGILTLETVQAWYTPYFSRAEHQLFAVYADKALIGYGRCPILIRPIEAAKLASSLAKNSI